MSKTLIQLQSRLIDAVQGKQERGATMVEYGLLVAFIAIVVGAAAKIFGTSLAGLFSGISFT